MITPLERALWPFYGRVAVAHVQGSPKGGGAWVEFVSGYHNLAPAEKMMRFQLPGEHTLEEFQEVISNLTETLQSNGIDSIRHINIYFQACSKRRQVKFVNEGTDVEHLIFENGVI